MAFIPVEWSNRTNIYEVNLRQYTAEGTFLAFSKSLARLRDMGIEVLWFMPVTPISWLNRKGSLGSYYACADYVKTNPEFGTLDDFGELVRQAHGMGFKVIIDWVANHTGWDHRWTKEHPEYYLRDAQGQFTERNGWDDVIDLDYENAALRRAVIEAMGFWVEQFDIDGFRCDMAHLVPLDFWVEARTALDAVKPLFWLAECELASYHEAFDASYTWRWMHKSEEFSRHQTGLQGLWDLLFQYDHDFPTTAMRTYFTSNHDENSWNGTEYEKFGEAAKNLAVFSSIWNGLPLIYSGQELPNYRRLKFFDKDPIDWSEPCVLHEFYKTLLSLRRRHPALRAADKEVNTRKVNTSNEENVMCFLRMQNTRQVLTILNFSAANISLNLFDKELSGIFRSVFTEFTIDFGVAQQVPLSPWGWLVMES